jgi:SNF2 family DNA or RNA helicase
MRGVTVGAAESCPDGSIVKPRGAATPVAQKAPVTQKAAGELYAHQQEAFDQFKDAAEIAEFMDQGTGKSAVLLRLAGYKFKKGQIDALLIVAPNDVHYQWYTDQLPLWLDCPYNAQCLYGRGGQKVAYPFDDDPGFLQVVCVNIDTFSVSTSNKWKDIVDWANMHKTFICVDEASVLKNMSAMRTQRMLYAFNDVKYRKKTIISSMRKSVARAVLTGTPVSNGPLDLFCIMEFLRPMYFGRNYYSFKARYGMFTQLVVNDSVIQIPLSEDCWHGIKAISSWHEANAIFGCSEDTFNYIHTQDHYEGPYKHAGELRALIQPVAYFKQLKDCIDMPPQNYVVRELIMTPEIAQCYNDMVTEMIAEYEGHTMTAKSKLTIIIRLQQICSGFIYDKHYGQEEEDGVWTEALKAFNEGREPVATEPKVVDHLKSLYGLGDDYDIVPDEIQWIGKSNPKLDAIYRDVDEASKPVIIATRFTAEADRIYNDLSKRYTCCLATGWKRVGTIEEFKQGKYQVMVANSAVISHGLNLQNSHCILMYSNTFSLETRLQLESRIYRIGQQSPCEYVDYIYPESIDTKIVSALRLKRNLLDFVRGVDSIKELVF